MAKVFLSAGHGGSDPGAVGNGLQEKNINLGIMLACRDELQRNGITVVTSRTTDENDPVQEEVREANASGADVAVSFHTNAGGGDGSESFYYKSSANGKRLAELCEKHIVAIGQNSRGVKTNNLMFTRATKMVAVLCECAFIDTTADIQAVDTAAEQQRFGVAYAAAIMEYLGISAKASATQTAQPATSATNTATTAQKAATSGELAIDGLWGVETTKAVQMALGTPVDGIVSNQSAADLAKCNDGGLLSSSWKTGTGGSPMVRALQKKIGSTADGYMGKNTVKALQRYLSTTQDGKVSKPSSMVKALQKRLNNGIF